MKALSLFVLTLLSGTIAPAQQAVKTRCPRISADIIGTPAIGKPLTVRVVSDLPLDSSIAYSWSSTGEILSGQGTREVVVRMPGDSSTVKVDVMGPNNCHESAAVSTSIDRAPPPSRLLANLTRLPRGLSDRSSRSISRRLTADPTTRLYVILNGNDQKWINEIQKQLHRKLLGDGDPMERRLVFVRGSKRDNSVAIWLVPAGAIPPPP